MTRSKKSLLPLLFLGLLCSCSKKSTHIPHKAPVVTPSDEQQTNQTSDSQSNERRQLKHNSQGLDSVLGQAADDMAHTMGNTFRQLKEVLDEVEQKIDASIDGEVNRLIFYQSFPAGNLKHLNFLGRAFDDDIQIVESDTDTIEIEYLILTDVDNLSDGDRLSKALGYKIIGDELQIMSDIKSYFCITIQNIVNGKRKVSVTGACYDRVIVKLPSALSISVAHDGLVQNGLPGRYIDTNGFIKRLSDSPFQSDREEVLDQFVASRNNDFVLQARELEEILEEFAFSDERLRGFKQLAKFVPASQRPKLRDIIEDAFFSSDEKRATRVLLSLR